jgi:hypothetical protein
MTELMQLLHAQRTFAVSAVIVGSLAALHLLLLGY